MPTLSEIADGGTAYSRAFASAPWTVPSHASLFTGMYPSKHGTHGDHTYLDDSHRLLAESFADSGYETIAVSNNTWVTEEFGFARGFETFWKGWQYLQSDADMGTVVRADETAEKLRRARAHLFEGNPVVNAVNLAYSELVQPNGDDGAARTTDIVVSWLRERYDARGGDGDGDLFGDVVAGQFGAGRPVRDGGADGDRPFFLFVNYIEPHIEYKPPREHAEPFLPEDASYEEALEVRQDPRAFDVGEYDLSNRELRLLYGLYCGELSYVDSQIDRLRSTLREVGEWENTLLVVVGDHGENIGDHGFLGHQYNLYDTVLHVPLVVHGGPFAGGAPNADALVQLPDLVPTLLDALDVDDPELREQSQGRSFHPEAGSERDAVYAEYVAPQPSMERLEERFGHLPEHVREYDRSLTAVRTREHKYIVGSDGTEELYDVVADPAERRDLSADRRELAADLADRLERWQSSFEDAPGDDREEVAISTSTEQRLEDLGYM